MRNTNNILFSKPEGKRPLGRHRHRWEGNIKMDREEIGWDSILWVHLAQVMDM
jgi:hypothetical protein